MAKCGSANGARLERDRSVLIQRVEAIQAWSRRVRAENLRIGFVPTMGDLHEGHLSLMRLAMKRCDRLVVSVFVNPIQFGPREDFANYPRDLDRDMASMTAIGAAVCFAPSVEEIYPPGDETRVDVRWSTDKLCGAQRPGHFDGVTNVVARLFNAVLPDDAFFGQKDAQQALIIQRMTRTLHFPVKLHLGETVREADGLAMSSRNAYLNPAERRCAVTLNQALKVVGEALGSGERDLDRLIQLGRDHMIQAGTEPEYFAVVDPETLDPPSGIGEGLLLVACAARFGNARLIDNRVFQIGGDGVRETLLF